MNHRHTIDPEDRYPASGLRHVERNALRVLEHLPLARMERTRDAIQIVDGDEAGVVVLVTAEAIEVRLPTVEWTCGAYGPASASRLWRRVQVDKLTDKRLQGLIRRALKARRDEFKPCKYCGNAFPPERRSSDDVCHGCAERHQGVVF